MTSDQQRRIDRFASELRSARARSGITQEQLGALIGVDGSTISGWEKPRVVRVPDVESIGLLEGALGVLDNALLRAAGYAPSGEVALAITEDAFGGRTLEVVWARTAPQGVRDLLDQGMPEEADRLAAMMGGVVVDGEFVGDAPAPVLEGVPTSRGDGVSPRELAEILDDIQRRLAALEADREK